MTESTALATYSDYTPIIELVTDSVISPHSRRAYRRALDAFMKWYDAERRPGLTKATVNKYRTHLLDIGLSSSTINQALSAIRKLATEAADNGKMDSGLAEGIGRVEGVKRHGVRTGNWLVKEDAQALIDTPNVATLKGLRDRALLAVMLGGGLRRSEVANLLFSDVQMREARWVIVDLVGKHNRMRTVPIPSWVKVAIDEWATAANISEGRIFRSVNRGGKVSGDAMTPQAIYNVVAEYGDVAKAHDLRRTFAKLAHKGGAPLEQIQLTLGHSSIQTTERYLGVEQNLTQAPCDVLGLGLVR